MVNYNNGKIYKIVADNGEEGDVYIGSTTKKRLCDRMVQHRYTYKKWKEGEYHKFSSFDLFEKYGIENCKIILVEEFNCDTKDQLLKHESYYIESTHCVNKCIPNRTRKKYCEANKDKKKLIDKKYAEVNKERLKEANSKSFYCECGSICRYGDKAKHMRTIKHQNYLKQI